MSLSAAAIDALIAAGVTAEQLGAAVKAELAAAEAAKGERRAKDADRKRRSRANVRDVTRTSCDSIGQGVTERDPSPLPPSPQTPQPPTPSPGYISTREGPSRVAILAEAQEAQRQFERFWLAYPRRVAKPKAQEAYFRALKRIGGPDPPSVIRDGLEAHLPSWADTEPDLVPHPTTWLNQDRFNDRPEPRQPRLIHDRRSPSGSDRRAAAYAERMQDIDAAFDAAARSVGSG